MFPEPGVPFVTGPLDVLCRLGCTGRWSSFPPPEAQPCPTLPSEGQLAATRPPVPQPQKHGLQVRLKPSASEPSRGPREGGAILTKTHPFGSAHTLWKVDG